MQLTLNKLSRAQIEDISSGRSLPSVDSKPLLEQGPPLPKRKAHVFQHELVAHQTVGIQMIEHITHHLEITGILDDESAMGLL